jgi:hypothetical protein
VKASNAGIVETSEPQATVDKWQPAFEVPPKVEIEFQIVFEEQCKLGIAFCEEPFEPTLRIAC